MSRVSPVSGLVLGSAVVLSGPALWGFAVHGSVPLDVALLRFLVTVAVAWVALSLFVALVVPDRPSRPATEVEAVPIPGDDAASGTPPYPQAGPAGPLAP